MKNANKLKRFYAATEKKDYATINRQQILEKKNKTKTLKTKKRIKVTYRLFGTIPSA